MLRPYKKCNLNHKAMLQWRIIDLGFAAEKIVVHEGKGVRYFTATECQTLNIGFGFGEQIMRYYTGRTT
jgi:hypothetical protein